MSINSINPFNGELLETFEEMTPVQINAAISTADNAFKTWRNTSFSERATVLKRVANLYRERREELALLMANEMG